MEEREVHTEQPIDADVAIVGYGPVGQVLAALLGRAGHRVAVVERFREIYRLPRAVHIDHEIMRLLQSLGVAERLADEMVPMSEYQWFGADRQPLLTLTPATPAASAWESDYMFFQPALEGALTAHVCGLESVTVQRGWSAEELVAAQDGVVLTVRRHEEPEPGRLVPTEHTRAIRARWVIGADGANSFVRQASAITRRDLGFAERWLVVDAEPDDMGALAELPIACQWCDPQRPTTHVQSGPRHRRWEFMLLPHEDPADFQDPARVWGLLGPWFKPGDGGLTRSSVYEFRSMLANRMRSGRVLLVGDAAHLTPPFLGQGLCSGVRDASNLAWKLDLVLRDVAGEALLDSVDAERQPHNEWVINLAVALGQVLCQLDVEAAAERDRMMRQADAAPPIAFPALTAGLLHRPAGGAPDQLAGTLSVQGRVAAAGREGRFDDIAGGGFQLIVLRGDPLQLLDTAQQSLLAALDVAVASLDPDALHGVRDLDGRLTAWLQDNGAYAVLVRPDFYVFGSVAQPSQLPSLLSDLQAQMGIKLKQLHHAPQESAQHA